ncbi:MAG: sugar ABC transporter permease [Acholeplasmataceae bacterium]|nr:sugar ABC transporter permease [Acholeplasmataceae bacterium]
MSLYERRGRTSTFVGLKNFQLIFDQSTYLGSEFINSLKVTFTYVFVTVPLILIVSLLIAYVLALKIKGVGFFRTSFYMPTVLGANVAIIVLWRYIFEYNGLINQGLKLLGFAPISFLGTAAGAMTSIVLLRVWQFGSTMLIFLNALKNVPETLYEAATIDGASKFRQFFSVTIPMITPIILFNGVMRLVETFQVFNGPVLITNGGPERSTNVINKLIYDIAFLGGDLNVGTAMSWVLFVIIMMFTILIFRSSRYWVHYQD